MGWYQRRVHGVAEVGKLKLQLDQGRDLLSIPKTAWNSSVLELEPRSKKRRLGDFPNAPKASPRIAIDVASGADEEKGTCLEVLEDPYGGVAAFAEDEPTSASYGGVAAFAKD